MTYKTKVVVCSEIRTKISMQGDSSSLCNLLHSPVTSSLLGPNILLNTMFSAVIPRSKPSPTPLHKTSLLLLYNAKVVVYAEIHTKTSTRLMSTM